MSNTGNRGTTSTSNGFAAVRMPRAALCTSAIDGIMLP